ncbi:MAG: GPR endopeptidase [Oscillospiraceae bacterium]|jgi:spore protease|nr:GPR endopeptidase [Oscillospiraceae bacterium]
MESRTDLALEIHEMLKAGDGKGVYTSSEKHGKMTVSMINITSPMGALRMNKPMGEYITISCPPFSDNIEMASEEIEIIAGKIACLLPKNKDLALVVGLGNRNITPDALGPSVIERILATRHISDDVKRSTGLEMLRPVAAISPGVLGQTGVETAEIIHSVVSEISPGVVIVIDALASRSASRLGTTIQISNTGISPGSGVLNKRKEISAQSLGCPVISIGTPTVVDLISLIKEIAQTDDLSAYKDKIEPRGEPMMLTPKEIDLIISRASRVVAMAINRALQPEVAAKDIEYLVS